MKLFLKTGLSFIIGMHAVMAYADVLQHRFASVHDYHGRVNSWNIKKNEGVIRQKLDASCGAAALATILKYYYGLEVSEEDMMQTAEKQEWFSFADMAGVLEKYQFKGIGLALNFNQLTKLKVPAIVYIETRSYPHFAVLRSINEDYVILADPAQGNSRYPVDKFLEKWNTRDDPDYKGKILVPIPEATTTSLNIQKEYFNRDNSDAGLEENLITIKRTLISY